MPGEEWAPGRAAARRPRLPGAAERAARREMLGTRSPGYPATQGPQPPTAPGRGLRRLGCWSKGGRRAPGKVKSGSGRERRRGQGITPTPTRGVPTCARARAAASAKHVPGAAAGTAARRFPGRRAAPRARGAAVAAAAGWPVPGRGAAQVNLSCPRRPGGAAAPAVAAASLWGWRRQPAPSHSGLSCFCCRCCPLGRPGGLSWWEAAGPHPLGMTRTLRSGLGDTDREIREGFLSYERRLRE